MIVMRVFIFILLFAYLALSQYVQPQYAEIRAVSAMCSSDGITASIDFDKPFTGKVYSLNYENVNDCLYYNNLDRDTVLFSIPAHICGTQLQRSTRNMIDQMENRVYVQMDKDTQTSADKQFSFVCKLTDSSGITQNTSTTRTPVARDVAPIKPVASSVSTKMSSPITPVQSDIQQVSAIARDPVHVGNWPIPGSKPYEPSMKPVSTYPQAPLVPAVPPLLPPLSAPTIPIAPPAPSMPVFQKDAYTFSNRPISAVGNQPTVSSFSSVQKSPPMAHLFTTSSTTTTASTPLMPIIPNVHFKQGVGVPFESAAPAATKVNADRWSDGYATPPNQVQTSTVPSHDAEIVYKDHMASDDSRFSNRVDNDATTIESSSDANTSTVLKTTQEKPIEPEVTLEIQRGEGPFAPPVTTPLKIGDNISLVVKAKSFLNDKSQYDMFVHSCFATDGKGSAKVQIIDENGRRTKGRSSDQRKTDQRKKCVIRREFASPLRRAKDDEKEMFYYVMIKAFKFPGPDDVYFSCSIEFTPTILAPAICTSHRLRRELEHNTSHSAVRLFDSINVELVNDDKPKAARLEASECDTNRWLYLVTIGVTLIALLISFGFNFYYLFKMRFKN